MVDRLTNTANNVEQSLVEVLQNSNQYDFLTSFSTSWDLVSMNVPNESCDFRRLKTKINSFVRDYPIIVTEIKDYFYDELIEHILKRSFRVQFTATDSMHTHRLFKRFFNDQDANIRIIFDYFFDDVKPLLLSDQFQGLPWSLRQAIMYTPKSILLTLTMAWLNLKGGESVTSMLYRNLIPQPQNHNENTVQQNSSVVTFSFDRGNIWLFIIIFIFLLIAINIHSIGTIINCSASLLIIGFILYYTGFSR